jgi:hypothetical protein
MQGAPVVGAVLQRFPARLRILIGASRHYNAQRPFRTAGWENETDGSAPLRVQNEQPGEVCGLVRLFVLSFSKGDVGAAGPPLFELLSCDACLDS